MHELGQGSAKYMWLDDADVLATQMMISLDFQHAPPSQASEQAVPRDDDSEVLQLMQEQVGLFLSEAPDSTNNPQQEVTTQGSPGANIGNANQPTSCLLL